MTLIQAFNNHSVRKYRYIQTCRQRKRQTNR